MREQVIIDGCKFCSKCGQLKKMDQYWKIYKTKSNTQSQCKDCKRKQDKDPQNKARIARYQRKYHEKPGVREKMQLAKNERRKKKRLLLIKAYGGKCVGCGFDDPRALQIDHVNGGGRKEMREYINYDSYMKMVFDNIDSGKYQLLCANCNFIKRDENNELPFQKKGILSCL